MIASIVMSTALGADSFFNYGTYSILNNRQVVSIPAARTIMWDRGQATHLAPGVWVGYGWEEFPAGASALFLLAATESAPAHDTKDVSNPFGFLEAHRPIGDPPE
jgi:hypothetical protein